MNRISTLSQAIDEGPSESQLRVSKPIKRRLRGSCDKCRQKKIKCDSAKMPDHICTNCRELDVKCTHVFTRMPKKPEMQHAYILSLEERIEKLEDYIRELHPGEDIDRVINEKLRPSTTTAGSSPQSSGDSKYSESVASKSMSPEVVTPIVNPDDDSELSEADDLAHVALAEHLGQLSMDVVEDRFFGQASAFMLAKQVATLRCEVTRSTSTAPDPRKYRRPLYWEMRPWEVDFVTSAAETSYIYPETDLLFSLVGLYFDKINSLFPVLHRPTFMKSLSQGQHLWDSSFGMTVLLVCAIGSKESQDPRVIVPNDASGLSAGWRFFCQVPMHRKKMLYKSSLYDLQYYALAVLYLNGTSMIHAAWNILGIGLRYALEKGAHRRKGPNEKPTVESELQKRAFWAIVCLDRLGGAVVGRPCGFPHEAFDVDYPIECDDEYWETDDPKMAFKQPPGKPCSVTSFVCFIKLCEILGFTLRTLYTNKKSKLISGFIGNEWERRMVAELDSSMNKWKDSLPDYLRWDPTRKNTLFFNQSMDLHATYCYVQIQIHRPFLTKSSNLSFASLAMCTNAARFCTHVLEAAMTRGSTFLPHASLAAFTAGSIIALGLWGNHRSGCIGDPQKEIQLLQKCLNALQVSEIRWHAAGRLADILKEAAAVEEYPRQAQSVDAVFSSFPSAETFIRTPTAIVTRNASAATATYATSAAPMNEWDLERLLLTEIGYLQGYSRENIESIAIGGTPVNEVQVPPFPASIPPPPPLHQTSEFPSGTDMYALWSDIPNTFNSLEEWENYLTSMGQKYSF